MTDILVPQQREGEIRQDGEKVLVLVNGQLVLTLNWDSAIHFSRAVYAVAKKAEEQAKAEQIIADQAILQRVGVPVGLVTRPDMAREALKEAAWNSDLRRYIPSSSNAIPGLVFAPTITQHPPESDD